MSSHSSGLRLTPKTKLYPSQSTFRNQEEDRLQFALRTVIGTTTTCPSAFQCHSGASAFAYCAGPAVIVCDVAEDLSIVQTLYRARPNAQPVNPASSFYNPTSPPATPTRNRHISPLRDLAGPNGAIGLPEQRLDSPGSGKSHHRAREATCLSLSREKEVLAVGETGYNPRVILFALAPNATPEVPLSVLSDHSFGVQSVAFSPDSKWLGTLGNSFDGFLLLYSVNLKNGATKLHSSNKCSNVTAIIWMGDAIVSYGLRHVKIWRIEKTESQRKTRPRMEPSLPTISSPSPKALAGRNCILGDLIDANFTCAVAISESEVILGTSKGDVCILDDTAKSQRLELVVRVPFAVETVACDQEDSLLWAGGAAGGLQAFHLEDLRTRKVVVDSYADPVHPEQAKIVALGSVSRRLLTMSGDHVVRFSIPKSEKQPFDDVDHVKVLPAHDSPVLGVCFLPNWPESAAQFLTYSAQGKVLLWRFDGSCVGSLNVSLKLHPDIASFEANELKAMSAVDGLPCVLCGDKIGNLMLLDDSGDISYQVQAHASDVNGISTTNRLGQRLVCTSGRDRTMQLFHYSGREINLWQTLDDHMASVTDAKFCDDASTLISISLDRTVGIRKAAQGPDGQIAFLLTRAITLKSSPVSLALVPFDSNAILVSTMDRQIQRFEIESGRSLQAFKATDPLTGDSVMINCLQAARLDSAEGSKTILLAVSATDRSLRIHDYDTGALLARENGQAIVSSATILQSGSEFDEEPRILSCGHDGTVIIYDLIPRLSPRFGSPCNSPVRVESPLRQTPTTLPPARKTLTKAQISELQKSLDDQQSDSVSPLRSPSPTRLRPKTSRYSLAARTANLSSSNLGTSQYGSDRSGARRSSQENSPKNASPQHSLKASKPKARPSLDPRRRSKSAANLNDLNLNADQLCETLRTFRKRLSSAVADKLNQDTRRELQSELQLALRAMAEGEENRKEEMPFKPGAEAFDAYLAKMIDERLAINSPPKQIVGPGDTQAQAGKDDKSLIVE